MQDMNLSGSEIRWCITLREAVQPLSY